MSKKIHCNSYAVCGKSCIQKSDVVVSLLPHAKDYMIEHGMKPDHFRYIPNGVAINEWMHRRSFLMSIEKHSRD